jgi:hypothetical protein
MCAASKVDFKTIDQVPIKMNWISIKKLSPLVYRPETYCSYIPSIGSFNTMCVVGELNEQVLVRGNGELRSNCLTVLRRCPWERECGRRTEGAKASTSRPLWFKPSWRSGGYCFEIYFIPLFWVCAAIRIIEISTRFGRNESRSMKS